MPRKPRPVLCTLNKVNVQVLANTIQDTGSDFSAPQGTVKLTAEKSLLQTPLVLNTRTHSQTQGIDGLRVVNVTQKISLQSGKPPVVIAKDIDISVKNGNLVLVAPILLATDKIVLSSPQGLISIVPATFKHDISTEEYSLGLSFFGSAAIEAMMQRDYRNAALNLLREFPFIASMEALLKSNNGVADTIADGMKTLYNAYKLYKSFAENPLSKFIKGQIDTTIKLRYGSRNSQQVWTEVALAWLQARKVIIIARNIQSKGTKIDCEDLTAIADENISFEAAEQQARMSMKSQGISFGIDFALMPSVGMDMAIAEQKSLEYITSRFNVSGTTKLIAGNQLSLRGVMLETLHAILQAKNLNVETLQDKANSDHTNLNVSVGASGLGLGFGAGQSTKQSAGEQTGIHAKGTLFVNIEDTIKLLGATILADGNSKTVPCLENGNLVHYYELPLPKENSLLSVLRLDSNKLLNELDALSYHALCMQFALDLSHKRLPETATTSHWCHRLAENSQALTSVALDIEKNMHKASLCEFLPEKLSRLDLLATYPEFPTLSYDVDILTIIAKQQKVQIQVWSLDTKGVLQPLFMTPGEYAKQIKLSYSPRDKSWQLLSAKPGHIEAQVISGTALFNYEGSQSFGFNVDIGLQSTASAIKGTMDAHFTQSKKESVMRSTISDSIHLESNNVSGINRDRTKAYETLRDEKQHYRVFCLLGNPFKIAEEMQQTFSQPTMRPTQSNALKVNNDKPLQTAYQNHVKVQKKTQNYARNKKDTKPKHVTKGSSIEISFGVKPPMASYLKGTKFKPKDTVRNRITKGLDFFIPPVVASEHSDLRTAKGYKIYQRNICTASVDISEDSLWPTKAMLKTIDPKTAVTTYNRNIDREYRKKEIEKILYQHYQLRGQLPSNNIGITGNIKMNLGRWTGAAVSAFDLATSTLSLIANPEAAFKGIKQFILHPIDTGSKLLYDLNGREQNIRLGYAQGDYFTAGLEETRLSVDTLSLLIGGYGAAKFTCKLASNIPKSTNYFFQRSSHADFNPEIIARAASVVEQLDTSIIRASHLTEGFGWTTHWNSVRCTGASNISHYGLHSLRKPTIIEFRISARIRNYLSDVNDISWVQLTNDLSSMGLKNISRHPDFPRFIDSKGRVRAMLHHADKRTPYDHLHLFDGKGNPLSIRLQPVKNNSRDAHIFIKQDAQHKNTIKNQ